MSKEKIAKLEKAVGVKLTGRLAGKAENDSVIIEAAGGLLTVSKSDVLHIAELKDGTSEVTVNPNSKIVYETLVHPSQIAGIVGASGLGVMPNRCVECSRCAGGECECSRCVNSMPNRCVECSRCAGGECECSQCNDAPSGFGRGGRNAFVRGIY